MVDVKGILAHCGKVAIYETCDPQWRTYRDKGKYYIANFRIEEGRVECMYLKKEEDLKTVIDAIEIAVLKNRRTPEYYDTIQTSDELILFSSGRGTDMITLYLAGEFVGRGKYVIKQNGSTSMYIKDDSTLDNLYTALKSVTLSQNISIITAPSKIYDRFADLDYTV